MAKQARVHPNYYQDENQILGRQRVIWYLKSKIDVRMFKMLNIGDKCKFTVANKIIKYVFMQDKNTIFKKPKHKGCWVQSNNGVFKLM